MKQNLTMGLLLWAAVACRASSGNQSATAATSPNTTANATGSATGSGASGQTSTVVSPNGLYRYVGRFGNMTSNSLTNPNQLLFAWPGTSVGATFSGTGIVANVTIAPGTSYSTSDVFLSVQLDGNDLNDIEILPGTTQVTLAQNLTNGNHTVWMRKRTETLTGTLLFSGFSAISGSLQGAVLPTAHSIEVIGASNECGYGDLASVTANNMCTFSPQTESVLVAYPYLIAQALGAEVTVNAYSGKGVYQNTDPNTDSLTMPMIYPLINPQGSLTDPNNQWNFSTTPDLVIVDLGGNDFNADVPPEQPFIAAYSGFLQTVRQHYPHALILAILGPLSTDPNDALLESYQEMGVAQLNDPNTLYLALTTYYGPTYGCDYHPDAALQQAMAQQILTFLSSHLAW